MRYRWMFPEGGTRETVLPTHSGSSSRTANEGARCDHRTEQPTPGRNTPGSPSGRTDGPGQGVVLRSAGGTPVGVPARGPRPEDVGLQVPAGRFGRGRPPRRRRCARPERRDRSGRAARGAPARRGGVRTHPYRFEVQRRHVFEPAVDGPVPERWSSAEEDDGVGEPIRFECFWVPLSAAHVWRSGQGALIGRLFD